MYLNQDDQSIVTDSVQENTPAINNNTPSEIVNEAAEGGTFAEGKQIVLQHDSILSALLTELKPINFYEKAGLSDGESLTKRHYIIITIEEVLAIAKQNH